MSYRRHHHRREGRGQLNSLDLIPEHAQHEVQWALGQLKQRQRTQTDILFEFNDRLEALGVEPISKSAFYRCSMRTAVMARRMAERREIMAGIAESYTPESIDQENMVLGQMLKTLIAEILDDPDLPPKEALSLARAYREIIQGQKSSTENLQKQKDAAIQKAEQAVDAAVEHGSIDQERAAEILAQIRKVYEGGA